jgi:dihydropyrimidine dehydrogenase (NAD+) subunit PreA
MVDYFPRSGLAPRLMGQEIDRIRQAFPDRPLLVSLAAGDHTGTWQELIQQLDEHGADGFEIQGGWADPAGALRELGQDSGATRRAVTWAREVTTRRLVVKLSPNVGDILPVASAALEAGADGFTATGGLSALGGIDPDTLLPLPVKDPAHMVGSYRGPGLKPVALRWTASLARRLDSPIFGCGGVAKWQDAAEFLALGASAVQVGSAVEWEGVGIIGRLTAGLQEYLERKGFASPADLVGRALPNLAEFDDLNLDSQIVAVIDETRCTGCDVCIRACWSGGYQAIEHVGALARVDRLKCDGCGLCMYVCPEGAIRTIPKQAA